jgi:hypothetical protein
MANRRGRETARADATGRGAPGRLRLRVRWGHKSPWFTVGSLTSDRRCCTRQTERGGLRRKREEIRAWRAGSVPGAGAGQGL